MKEKEFWVENQSLVTADVQASPKLFFFRHIVDNEILQGCVIEEWHFTFLHTNVN